MTQRGEPIGLTAVIGIPDPAFALSAWLDHLCAALTVHAGSLQIILVTPLGAQRIERIANLCTIEWLQVARISHVALARIACEHAIYPFIVTYIVSNRFLLNTANLKTLWYNQSCADLLVLRRFANRSLGSVGLLSRLLSRILSLPVRDVFSPCRLYRRDMLMALRSRLPLDDSLADELELLLHIAAEGYRMREIDVKDWMPAYAANGQPPRLDLRRLVSLWRLRNSILSADYDDRAYDSIIPLQRYWQRQRFRLIQELIAGEGAVLDIGCGSSRILSVLPEGSIGMDILFRKLRYARRFTTTLVQASGDRIPVADAAFPCVLCSQVIEHVPKQSPILDELCRVLRPGGRLVIGTPDYARWEWRLIERLYAALAPGGYADEHIAHYSRQELLDFFASRSFVHEATRYILNGELIMAFRKNK